MKLKIDLYGALREVDARGYVELEVPEKSTVGGLRPLLADYVKTAAPNVPQGLIAASVFANEAAILHDSTYLEGSATLACLPPVSGG